MMRMAAVGDRTWSEGTGNKACLEAAWNGRSTEWGLDIRTILLTWFVIRRVTGVIKRQGRRRSIIAVNVILQHVILPKALG